MIHETTNLALTVSGMANAVMVGALAGAAYLIRRQGQRIMRLGGEDHALRAELTIAEAEIHRLMAASDRTATDLQELRDENVRLLRTMVTGEAS